MVLVRNFFLFTGKSFSRVKRLTSNTVSKTTQRVYTRGNNESYHRMKYMFDQYQDIRLPCTKRFGLTFSNAQVHLYPYFVDSNNNEVYHFLNDYEEHGENLHSFYLDFKPLFRNGMKEVENFISNHANNTGLSPTQHKLGEAVKTFLQQKEYHEECLSDLVRNTNVSYTELETTALLISHLISPSVSLDPKGQLSNYIINNDKKKPKYLPVLVQRTVVQTLYMVTLDLRKYQTERKESSYITSLIPTIFSTRHHFDVYLYDAENDILLRNFGSPMPLFEKEETWSGVEKFQKYELCFKTLDVDQSFVVTARINCNSGQCAEKYMWHSKTNRDVKYDEKCRGEFGGRLYLWST